MQRKYIILSAIVLVVAVLGLIFFWKKENSSTPPEINFEGEGNGEVVVEGQYTISPPEDFRAVKDSGEGYEITAYERNPKEGFQVFVTAFDEPDPITPERILIDVDIEINNPKYISVDGTQALAFNGADENLGKTFEVWFTHGGKLYQVLTYGSFEPQILKILETWKFQ